VWNPPLLSGDGIGKTVEISKAKKIKKAGSGHPQKAFASGRGMSKSSLMDTQGSDKILESTKVHKIIKRSHAADETARLLAYAVRNGIRSIAFCKTRMLAEWVFERCIALLKSEDSPTLSDKVEIYRGGYSASIRRNIEARLFKNELFGVVGTSALELGIDLGGIDLTLHCGFPGSYASLMQQAGRAGRGASTRGSSFAIMICFSSPSEQVRSQYL
jgi:DEAD/DEAH box helicase domain-containing protein